MAVKCCLSNDEQGWAALRSNTFPLITDARAINPCLDGLVTNKTDYENRDTSTNREEQTLVASERQLM